MRMGHLREWRYKRVQVSAFRAHYRTFWVNAEWRQSNRRISGGYHRRLHDKHALFRIGAKEGKRCLSPVRKKVQAEFVPCRVKGTTQGKQRHVFLRSARYSPVSLGQFMEILDCKLMDGVDSVHRPFNSGELHYVPVLPSPGPCRHWNTQILVWN